MRIRSFSLALLALALTGTINLAQDKEAQPLTGRLAPAKSSELKIDLEAYGGDLTLKTLLAPGMKVDKGDIVAEIEAPELQEKLAEAQDSHSRAQRSVQMLKDSVAHREKQAALGIENAERSLARAEEALAHFLEVRKTERVRESEMRLESRENSILDQEEELAQLERLYKGNDLAKESQDIVLNRSKRRLKQSKERFEMAKRAHERFVKVQLPREEEDLCHRLENAKLGVESAKSENLNGLTGQRLKLEGAEEGLKKAAEQLAKLKADAEKLTLKAPHAGVVVVGSMNGNDSVSQPLLVGDDVRKGQVLASVIDMTKLELTVNVTLEARANFQPGAAVTVKMNANAKTGDGKVEAIGFMVDKSGRVSARITVDNAEGALLPGAMASVSLKQ